jgi:hypothetical protein
LDSRHEALSNSLLGSLSASDFAILRPNLSAIDLPVRRQLESRNRPIQHVYFLRRGLASLVISTGANHSIEVGMIGQEGMTGLSLLLGSETAMHETFMHQPAMAGASARAICALPRRKAPPCTMRFCDLPMSWSTR